MTNHKQIINQVYSQLLQEEDKGVVASYIPQLANVPKNKLGLYLDFINGEAFGVGDYQERFSIQSISKVITLALAFSIDGDNIWKRVGVEPSGNPFNHLSLLESEKGIPRNPLINSGALVIADILISKLENPKKEFLQYVKDLADDQSIEFDESVAKSEKETGFKNYAITNLLKSFNNLTNDVDTVLDFYFYQCSITMSCKQLATAFYPFANKGNCYLNKSRISISQTKRINAIMLTCGFYDEAGEFAFEVGLPGKSGVGGGIIALLPNNFVIAVWSPGLNNKGNSYLGLLALEKYTSLTQASIF